MMFIWTEFLLFVILGKSNFFKINSDNYSKMKPIGVVEVYTTKISYRLFLLKI